MKELKQQIIISMQATRSLRAQAASLKTESRQTRRDGELAAAIVIMRKALDIRYEADHDRDQRRHMHLAYAWLKGRTYHECERTCTKLPYMQGILHFAQDHLTPQETIEDIKTWIGDGDVRRPRQILENVSEMEVVAA